MTSDPAQTNETIISLEEVEKSFKNDTAVLRGVSFAVNRGESIALIGGSGVGKSVVIKCILGLIRHDRGVIRVCGNEPSPGNLAGGARIGMLFQGGALFDSMTVMQNVAFQHLRGPNRIPVSDARELAAQKLRRVGLQPDVLDQYPSQLSGGMQKRAGLARAIATDPDILFFDEPTTGLDPVRAARINELICGIVAENKSTAVTITHDMSSVRTIASRVALLHEGVIEWSGSADDLDHDQNPCLRQFVSGSARGPLS